MKLYYFPLSTYSQKAMIAFNEKGISYEPIVVQLLEPAERAEFEKIYPIGKVPFLQANDRPVPESTSIIEYLEDEFPGTPRMIPTGNGEAPRQVRFMDRMTDLYFTEPLSELVSQQLGLRPKDDDKAARARKYIALTYAHWDQRLATRKWLCGDDFSMADCAAIPGLFYAQSVLPFAAHPHIVAYWQRAQQRPSYAKVRAEFEPMWNEMIAQDRAA
jgi:glutathione S-transferase